MGYCTEFEGTFKLNKKLSDEARTYLYLYNETRHFKRDIAKIGLDPDKFGKEGQLYAHVASLDGFAFDDSLILKDKNDLYLNLTKDFDFGIVRIDEKSSNFISPIDPNDRKKYGIIDYNAPAEGCPSLYCPWVPNSDGTEIQWDYNEKPYGYIEWIKFLIDNFLAPKDYILNGDVCWQGEDTHDMGKISIENNIIKIYKGEITYRLVKDYSNETSSERS